MNGYEKQHIRAEKNNKVREARLGWSGGVLRRENNYKDNLEVTGLLNKNAMGRKMKNNDLLR